MSGIGQHAPDHAMLAFRNGQRDDDEWLKGLKEKKQWHVEVY
jgi:hypothetical protein